jgi:hypothetical protein
MHPIGGRDIGWEPVRKSFEQVAELTTDGQVSLSDQFIQVVGDAAYEPDLKAAMEKSGVKGAPQADLVHHQGCQVASRSRAGRR